MRFLATGSPPFAAGRRFRIGLLCSLLWVWSPWSMAGLNPTLYYTHRSGSSSDYLPEYDITLESDTYQVLRETPGTLNLAEVDWRSSPSYARGYIVAYTSGDRLFILDGNDSSVRIDEYDPTSLQRIGGQVYIGNMDMFSDLSVKDIEISGDYVYWRNQDESFWQDAYGQEYFNMVTEARGFLQNQDCGKYFTSATHLFCAKVVNQSEQWESDGDYILFTRLDPATGATLAEWGYWDFSAFTQNGDIWSFAAEGAVIYAARPDGGKAELWRFDTQAFEASPVPANYPHLLFDTTLPGGTYESNYFPGFDVHRGMVLIDGYGIDMLTYDTATGAFDHFPTAVSAAEVQVRVVETPDGVINISTRGKVTAGGAMHGGFVIRSVPKTVLIKGLGPTLQDRGLSGVLSDPVLTLYSGQQVVAESDGWRTSGNCGTSTGLEPAYDNEACILRTLDPGAYTAVLSGAGGATGRAIVSVNDVSGDGDIINLSTRGNVIPGEENLTGGFVIRERQAEVLVKALGPTLADRGVAGTLGDPMLTLYSGQTAIAANDGWQGGSCAGTGLEPSHGAEPCIRTILGPGAYTAIVTSGDGSSGVAIVSVNTLE